MRHIANACTALAAAALALSLSACGGTSINSQTPHSEKAEETVTPASEPEPTDDPSQSSDQPHSLTDTVTYENNASVTLQGFSRGVSHDYAAPGNTPYIRFNVRVANGAKSTLDVTAMTVNCQYGDEEGKQAESIFDDGLEGSPSTKLLAGRTVNVPWACELPKNQQHVQIEVTPTPESAAAIYTGSIK
ncbi:hypothetical protein [Streptomyces tubercidicus]|uniref:DUF4352 domain-containing protein n=1 Tax=Streptomyces tubercidicus TaxID=47759 RepID=A0A640UTT5_9ACTN|nr:hypothetical protein [Streptomyces tubercidicus]WAU13264.1 hypothetical protein STRTU_003728 [Streptomyces tubercidicus]GFE38840.1 hypothetical protein Stube_35130 [Streptomyces tubercidicus]